MVGGYGKGYPSHPSKGVWGIAVKLPHRGLGRSFTVHSLQTTDVHTKILLPANSCEVTFFCCLIKC